MVGTLSLGFCCFFKKNWLHPEARGTLAPLPRMEPTNPALEVGVLITGLLGDS